MISKYDHRKEKNSIQDFQSLNFKKFSISKLTRF